MKHFIDIQDCTREEIMHLLSLAETIRAEIKSGVFRSDLKKKTVGLIFQKPSNRTRVSFEVGVAQIGRAHV